MSVKIIPSVAVVIKDDHDLVCAFLDWALKNRVWSLRETGGSTGLGGHSACYPAEHSARITKFFRAYKQTKAKTKYDRERETGHG